MTYEELGQKVKAKYPSYASMSDEDLGRSVAAKYPQYQAQITDKNILQKAAEFILPATTKFVGQVTTGAQTGSEADKVASANLPIEQQATELSRQIMAEKDPAKRKALADQQRQLMQGMQTVEGMQQKEQAINPYGADLSKTSGRFNLEYAKSGLGTAAELGPLLAGIKNPAPAVQGASALGRIGMATRIGGDIGFKTALAGSVLNPERGIVPTIQGKQGVGDLAGNVALQTGLGTVAGGTLGAAGQGIKEVFTPTNWIALRQQKPKDAIDQIINTKRGEFDFKGNDEITNLLQKAESAGKETAYTERPAVKQFLDGFNFPSKKFNELKPYETGSKMLEWKIQGNRDQLAAKVDRVTGSNGVINNLKNNAIAKLKGEVDLPTGIVRDAEDAMKKELSVAGGSQMKEFWDNVMRVQGTIGSEPGKVDPGKLYDLSRQFKAIGSDYIYKGKNYLTPNLKLENLGKMYMQVGQTLDDTVMAAVEKQGTLKPYLANKQVSDYLSRTVSPGFAKAYEAAKTVPELRGLEKYFVNLGKMIDYSQIGEQSSAGKVMNAAAQAMVKGPKGVVLGQLLKIPQSTAFTTAAGNVLEGAGRAASAVNQNVIQPTARRIETAGTALGSKTISDKLGSYLRALK